jgi:hypothetical protein
MSSYNSINPIGIVKLLNRLNCKTDIPFRRRDNQHHEDSGTTFPRLDQDQTREGLPVDPSPQAQPLSPNSRSPRLFGYQEIFHHVHTVPSLNYDAEVPSITAAKGRNWKVFVMVFHGLMFPYFRNTSS